MPYGMSVLYSFLKDHFVPVVQYDFLMEYLFVAAEDIDYHNPERSFSEDEFFSFLEGRGNHPGIEAFASKYGGRLVADAGMYAFSIVAYHQFWASLLLARYIRDINPTAVIIFGGPFITIKPSDSYVPYGQADYWVKGSGEAPLLMLYRLHQGDGNIAKERIPGITYFEGSRRIEAKSSTHPAEKERAPDFEGLPLDQYRYDHPVTGKQTLFLPYRISKGCPSRCSFCTGRLVDRYDTKSVDKIVGEVMGLAQTYRINAFQFADASINGNPRQLSDLCDKLPQEFPEIRWYSYAKVNGFSPELLRKVKAAGCFSLFWGVESAYQPTIKLLGKRFDVEDMYELIDEAIAVGIKNYIHLIYNAPHESEHDIAALKRLIERYIDSDMVVFLPQRFLLEAESLMFEHPERYGLSNVRQVQSSAFEREQFTYREEGLDYGDIQRRNERHRKMLEEHLEWIRYRTVINGSSSKLVRAIPSRLLVRSGKYVERSSLLRTVRERVIRWMESTGSEIKEQL